MAENKSSSNIVVIVLLLASLGLNGYFFFSGNTKQKQIDQLTAANDSLSKSFSTKETEYITTIETTSNDLDEYKGKSAELDSLLSVAQKDIAKKEARIKELKKDAGKSKELQVEIAALNQMKEQYLERIDSLLTVNNLLKDEIVTYQAVVESQTGQIVEQQKTIEKGSIITSDNVIALPQKEKSSGKLVATSIASKAKQVRVCFDLAENKIAAAGMKNVHLQVTTPDGTTLGSDATTFAIKDDGTQGRFTTTTTIEYQNQKNNYCINWAPEQALGKGNYTVKVYVDGYFSGVGAFILK